MPNGFVIAIDGPVASGKGTIAPKLAHLLHGFYLYTGAMFRSLALYCLENNIEFTDTEKILEQLPHVDLKLEDNCVILNGVDVTERIKEADVAHGSSFVAVAEPIRRNFADLQRKIAQDYLEKGMVVVGEGRDVGTIVFPDAEVKIFLTATPHIRAERRLAQYREKGDHSITLEQVLADTKERDARDMERSYAPLPKDPETLGYTIIDNSEMSEQKTLDAIIDELKKKGLYEN